MKTTIRFILIICIISNVFELKSQCENDYGNFTLTNQSDVDTYSGPQNVSALTITGNITSLLPLANKISCVVKLTIQNCPGLQTTDGLNDLYIIDELIIKGNSSLSDISSLEIQNSQVANQIQINNCPLITSLSALSNVESLSTLSITGLNGITSLNDLSSLQKVTTALYIRNNSLLNDISTLSNINKGLTVLWIFGNPNLENCIPACHLLEIATDVDIANNGGTECNSPTQVTHACQNTVCNQDEKYTECQEDTLYVDNSTYLDLTQIKQAKVKLKSDRTIDSGYDVQYKASECIELDPNFLVQGGAIFETIIDQCQFLGDYISDLKGFDFPNKDDFENNQTYPTSSLTIYCDKEKYYKSDQNAHVVIAMHKEAYGVCRSMDVRLYANGNLIDERFINVDFDKNVEFLINVQKLFNDGYMTVDLVVQKSNGQTATKTIEILNIDEFASASFANQIDLVLVKADEVTNSLESVLNGAVSFPNGYIKKSELENLQLNISNKKFLIHPISYWYKPGSDNDVYVKWVKLSIIGDVQSSYSIIKGNAINSNAIVDFNQEETPFTPFTTSLLSVDIMNDQVIVERSSSNDIMHMAPIVSMEAFDTVFDDVIFTENNDFRKVITIKGHYYDTPNSMMKMQFVSHLKVYDELDAISIDHQDIFIDDYISDQFIDQLGWYLQNPKFTGQGLNYWIKDNNTVQTISDNHIKQVQKNKFSIGSNTPVQGQIEGVFKLENWNIAVDNFSNKFPNEIEKSNDKLYIHSWPHHGNNASYTNSEIVSEENIHLLLDLHQGDKLELNVGQHVIDELINEQYTFGGYLLTNAANSVMCTDGHTHTFNVEDYNPAGMAIGSKFSLRFNDQGNDYQIGKNQIETPVLLPSGSWFAQTNIEPGLYDPAIPSFAYGDSMVIKAYPAYGNSFFDDDSTQSGKFTFGIMHDLASIDKDANGNISKTTRTGDNSNFIRTWSFSHYNNVSYAWLFSLLHPESASVGFARDISGAYRDIGTINMDVEDKVMKGTECNPSKKGAMAHAYMGVDGVAGNLFDKGFYYPWCSDYALSGHWINPTGHFFNALINDDLHSGGLYHSWFDSYYYSFKGVGGHREGIQTSTELLNHYQNTKDPRTLLLSNIVLQEENLKDGFSILNSYKQNFEERTPSQSQMADWHSGFLEKYLAQYRDTVRITKFLTDYFDDPLNDERYNAFRYIEMADRLGIALPDSEHLNRSLLFYTNYMLGGLYHDSNSDLDGYGILRGNSLSKIILHQIPYILKYLQLSGKDINDIYTLKKMGHYPDRSLGYTDPHTNKEPRARSVVIQMSDVLSNIHNTYRALPRFHRNEANTNINIDTLHLFADLDDLIDQNLKDDNAVLGLDYDSSRLVIPQDSTVNDTINNSSHEFVTLYINGGSNSAGINPFNAPLNNDGKHEVQRLYTSESANFSPCNPISDVSSSTDALCKNWSYLALGFNTYFINAINPDDEFEIFLSKNSNHNPEHVYPLYYRIMIPDVSISLTDYEADVDAFLDLNQTTPNLANASFSSGHLANFANDILSVENQVGAEYPIAIMLAQSGETYLEMRIDINEGTQDCFPDNLFLSTKHNYLVEFINEVRAANVTCN